MLPFFYHKRTVAASQHLCKNIRVLVSTATEAANRVKTCFETNFCRVFFPFIFLHLLLCRFARDQTRALISVEAALHHAITSLEAVGVGGGFLSTSITTTPFEHVYHSHRLRRFQPRAAKNLYEIVRQITPANYTCVRG